VSARQHDSASKFDSRPSRGDENKVFSAELLKELWLKIPTRNRDGLELGRFHATETEMHLSTRLKGFVAAVTPTLGAHARLYQEVHAWLDTLLAALVPNGTSLLPPKLFQLGSRSKKSEKGMFLAPSGHGGRKFKSFTAFNQGCQTCQDFFISFITAPLNSGINLHVATPIWSRMQLMRSLQMSARKGKRLS
jgi:hypothetical protein